MISAPSNGSFWNKNTFEEPVQSAEEILGGSLEETGIFLEFAGENPGWILKMVGKILDQKFVVQNNSHNILLHSSPSPPVCISTHQKHLKFPREMQGSEKMYRNLGIRQARMTRGEWNIFPEQKPPKACIQTIGRKRGGGLQFGVLFFQSAKKGAFIQNNGEKPRGACIWATKILKTPIQPHWPKQILSQPIPDHLTNPPPSSWDFPVSHFPPGQSLPIRDQPVLSCSWTDTRISSQRCLRWEIVRMVSLS